MDGWSIHKWCSCSFVRTSHPNLAMSACKGSKHSGSLARYTQKGISARIVARRQSINQSIDHPPTEPPYPNLQTNHPLGAARGLEREQVPLPKQLEGRAGGRRPVLHLHTGLVLAHDRRLLVRAARVGRVPLRLALCVGCGSKVLDGVGG